MGTAGVITFFRKEDCFLADKDADRGKTIGKDGGGGGTTGQADVPERGGGTGGGGGTLEQVNIPGRGGGIGGGGGGGGGGGRLVQVDIPWRGSGGGGGGGGGTGGTLGQLNILRGEEGVGGILSASSTAREVGVGPLFLSLDLGETGI